MTALGAEGRSFAQDAQRAQDYHHDPPQWNLDRPTYGVLTGERSHPHHGVSYEFGEGDGDANALVSQWGWVAGQLEWARERLNAVQFSPDWFPDGTSESGDYFAELNFLAGKYGLSTAVVGQDAQARIEQAATPAEVAQLHSYYSGQGRQSASLNSFEVSTAPGIRALFDAAITLARNLQAATRNAFAGYGEQDSLIAQTWTRSEQQL